MSYIICTVVPHALINIIEVCKMGKTVKDYEMQNTTMYTGEIISIKFSRDTYPFTLSIH